MVDDRLGDADSSAEAARTKREGPTIDLEASEVSSETKPAPPTEPAHEAAPEPEPPKAAVSDSAPGAKPMSPWLVAPLSGVVAAALVIAVGWVLGWPSVQAPPPAPQVTAATVDDLTGRIAALETKASRPAAPGSDPAALGRIDALEKSASALRSDVANLRAQSDKLANSVSAANAAPRDASGAVDLIALNERIDKLEQANRTQGDAMTTEKAAETKPADDKPLRLVVAAALLDVAVRHGDRFAAELAAAKSLSPNADALKPLESFATTGVPSPPVLCRELLALVPKLAPAAPEGTTTGTGIIDRLKAGATKLVKVERTDAVGSDRGAVVARVTAAALRNDVAETKRELDSLSPDDRVAAQAWLDKVKARDAALAASRQFAEQSMASLAN